MSAARNYRSVSSKLALAGIFVFSLAVCGCDTTGDLTKGWFNAGEVGRFKKEPLLLPIVQTLDTGIEEPNDQFTQAQDVKPDDLIANEQDYVVGRNDLLNISITDLVGPGVETVKSVRVSESGNVSLPLVGQVRAEGLTEQQLEDEIIRVYREKNLLPNATVSVTVAQALARTFSILGSINRPGQYQITQADFRILDALVTAGDINSQGVDYLYVVRREDIARRTAPASGPGPAGPGTRPPAPGTDVLQPPRSRADGIIDQPVFLAADTTGAAAAPASPAPPPTGTRGDGRVVQVDGKQMVVGNQGATAQPAAPAGTPALAQAQPAPNRGMAAPPAGARPGMAAPAPGAAAPGQGFEFRNPMTSENARTIRVPVAQLKNGDLRYNIVIKPQDMIIVPSPLFGEYYIDGHINRSGVYSLTARKISLKQAIAAAGGFDQLAVPTRTEVIRRIGDDKEVFALVNLDKVFAGQQPDIYLKPNDIVRVGTNMFQPFIASFRNAFRMTYGFGFLYDRNFAPQSPIQ